MYVIQTTFPLFLVLISIITNSPPHTATVPPSPSHYFTLYCRLKGRRHQGNKCLISKLSLPLFIIILLRSEKPGNCVSGISKDVVRPGRCAQHNRRAPFFERRKVVTLQKHSGNNTRVQRFHFRTTFCAYPVII